MIDATPDRLPTILVADDDPDLVALLSRRLTRAGYAVLTACDGQAALDAATQYLPQVAVLDVTMPWLSGPAVMARLRAQSATSQIRVILISAGFDRSQTNGLVSGADAHIAKPFGPTEVTEQVRAILAR